MKINWRTYWMLIKISWQDAVASRMEAIIWVIIDFFPFISTFFLWQAIFEDKTAIRGMSFQQLVSYYFLTILVVSLTEAHFDLWLAEMIKNGEIARFLIRPVNIFYTIAFNELGWKLLRNIFTLILISLLFLLVFDHLAFLEFNFPRLLLFLVFVFIGFSISVLLNFLTSFAAFWFEEAQVITHARWMIGGFFSGYMFPLALLPSTAQKLASLLPFRFVSFIPATIFLHPVPNWLGEIIMGIVWIIILFSLDSWIWRRGIKRFAAIGN